MYIIVCCSDDDGFKFRNSYLHLFYDQKYVTNAIV